MTSQKQREANFRNAQHSTGAKTEEGKKASRINATKHGLTGQTIVIAGEDPAEFEALHQRVSDEYEPDSLAMCLPAERFATDIWRLRRIPALEAAILELSRIVVEEKTPRQRS